MALWSQYSVCMSVSSSGRPSKSNVEPAAGRLRPRAARRCPGRCGRCRPSPSPLLGMPDGVLDSDDPGRRPPSISRASSITCADRASPRRRARRAAAGPHVVQGQRGPSRCRRAARPPGRPSGGVAVRGVRRPRRRPPSARGCGRATRPSRGRRPARRTPAATAGQQRVELLVVACDQRHPLGAQLARRRRRPPRGRRPGRAARAASVARVERLPLLVGEVLERRRCSRSPPGTGPQVEVGGDVPAPSVVAVADDRARAAARRRRARRARRRRARPWSSAPSASMRRLGERRVLHADDAAREVRGREERLGRRRAPCASGRAARRYP